MIAATPIGTACGRLLPGPLPLRLKARDGSAIGPEGAPAVVLRHPGAVRRLLCQPGGLGRAEAHVPAHPDAEGDIGMGRHAGTDQNPAFTVRLRSLLRPGRRLPVQQTSRGTTAPGGGASVETDVTPDMHMRPTGRTVDLVEDAGLEVVHVEAMREHHARTADARHDSLRDRRPEFVFLVGRPTLRLWQLCTAGPAFADGWTGVDPVLARRPGRSATVRPADRYEDLP
ncbi:hypothetical protein [Kitasatospora griseola]|uniref:hypothetical protein n=1 Tax=Kitasatospora griseola TaxID=2064 RepID=UPI00382C7DC8